MQLTGIHHLSAISANAPGNLHFYTQVMGMRLIKKTVNQDDVSAYHLFYGDGAASPGSDLTFFDYRTGPSRHGNNSITNTALRVNGLDALKWWRKHLDGAQVKVADIGERDGRWTLDFADPEGLQLSLVDDGGAGDAHPWMESPVPEEFQIRGLGPVTITVPDRMVSDVILRELLLMRHVRDYPVPDSQTDIVHVYEMGEGGPAAELHVAARPDVPRAQPGAGGVHHVAFRTPNRAEYDGWARRLVDLKVPNSGKVNRFYFESLYFRDPHGILFEIATDGPGFDADEPMEKLGETLSLPPFLEKRRAEIEATLKPL